MIKNEISLKDTKNNSLTPQNMSELYALADKMSVSSMVPNNYKNKAGDIAIAMMMGLEVGLNPMQSIRNITVINGNPCLWGDAMLALVQNSPKFISITESFDDRTNTATCIVLRKSGQPHKQTFSQEDAIIAGLWNSNVWKKYPKRMLAMRARGMSLRNQFADVLAGLSSAEEERDMPEIIINPYSENTETNETNETEILKQYTDEEFKKHFLTWSNIILEGRKTADEIITIVSTKATLSDCQIDKILKIKPSIK